MALRLDDQDWKKIFPKAPEPILKAFASDTHWLDGAGITESRTRLAYTLANVEHECGGFTVTNLTEIINYSAKRMAEVWPKRFASAAVVESKYGTAAGWQKKAFDDIYGNRMGNRPGTDDGSRFIGRGGPQITGRDGYLEVGGRCNLDLINDPDLATKAANQPAILAAFFSWKNLAKFADKEDFLGFVKAWNGGTIGLADRIALMNGNDPIISKLKTIPIITAFLNTSSFAASSPTLGSLLRSQSPSSFVVKLVEVCEGECAFFGDGAKKEYEDSVFRRVGDYWTELAKSPPYGSWAGYTGKSGVQFSPSGNVISNKNQPWSAAFISFVMSKAGAGSKFSYSPSHSVYIVKALEAAQKAGTTEVFIARRHKNYAPKPGDLIACERQPAIDPNFDTYKAYVAGGKYEAHCDVVTEVHDKYLMTIGGNVSNSVTRKKWPLDTNGMIGNFDPQSSTAGVICVIDNRL